MSWGHALAQIRPLESLVNSAKYFKCLNMTQILLTEQYFGLTCFLKTIKHRQTNKFSDYPTDHERRSFLPARFCMIGELLVNFGQDTNHKCMMIKSYEDFSPPPPQMIAGLSTSNES